MKKHTRNLIKDIITIILSFIYLFLIYFILYYLLKIFFSIKISFLITIIILIVVFIITNLSGYFLKKSIYKNSKKIEDYSQHLFEIFEEVKSKAILFNPKIQKINCYIFDNDHPLKEISLSSPAISMKGNIWIYDKALKSYDDYELKAIIGHELYHSVSLFMKIIEKVEALGFLPKIIFYSFFFLFQQIEKKIIEVKKTYMKIILRFLAVILASIAFLFRLPYNLLLSKMNVWEENNCDSLSINLGYGDGLKHVLRNIRGRKDSLITNLFFPIHPQDLNRLERINRLSGYSNDYLFYFFNKNILIGYEGNDDILFIPNFVNIIGNGKNRITNKKIQKVVIHDSTTKSFIIINSNAFRNLDIEEIIINDDISFIGDFAFYNCQMLHTMTPFVVKEKVSNINKKIDNNHQYISSSAFLNCNKLKIENYLFSCDHEFCITINEGTKFISDSIFSQNNIVTKMAYLPKSVIYVDIKCHLDYLVTEKEYSNVITYKTINEVINDIKENKLISLSYFDNEIYISLKNELDKCSSLKEISIIYQKYQFILNQKQAMLRKKDYHIHFHKQPYTLETINEMIKFAKKRNITDLYLLDHTHKFKEFIFLYDSITHKGSREWYDKKTPIPISDYLNFIEQVKKEKWDVNLHFGLEVCYFKEWEKETKELLDKYHFDFTIGSVHFVNGMGIDINKEYWNSIDVDKLYHDYYQLNIDLVNSHMFSFLGHPDVIKVYDILPSYDLGKEYEKLATALSNSDMEVENSSGLTRYNYPYLGMNKKLLKTLMNNHIKIHFSSDSHQADTIGNSFEKMFL